MLTPTWPSNPAIFEINTWVWLQDLSGKYGTAINLASVPSAEWDEIAKYRFDAVWLMGVWERSPAGRAIADQNAGNLKDFHRALPDFQLEDNVGSPYCIRNYTVDKHLGSDASLAVARDELARRGMRLILDFVPNHVAPDHPWATNHPEYFIGGTEEDAANDPSSYLRIGEKVLACGRDPYFPAWSDVLQLNTFNASLRQAATRTVTNIATQCDGVRCDMAMLLINSIFERTWSGRAGPTPQTEYWVDLIGTLKLAYPNFLFIAEAYWDMEWQLQQQGFDYCYDKRLYDRLEHGAPESVRLHLNADLAYQQKLLRFLENHDEPRAASAFPGAQETAAAVTIATLPGAKLFHEGQFEARKIRLPVFLGRRPPETSDEQCRTFYRKLLNLIADPAFHNGAWTQCASGNQNVSAWTWTFNDTRLLVVVNLSGHSEQSLLPLPWESLKGATWRLSGQLLDESYDRNGDALLSPGLYVDLQPWYAQCFGLQRLP